MRRLSVLFAELTLLALAFAPMAAADLTNRYVVKDNAGSVPYDSWANAAGNIQTVIDYGCTVAGETVLVASATYDTGGVTNYPVGELLTNRVAIWKAITVMSTNNDPANTIIKGEKPTGAAAVRCVYMTNGSKLIGFTLTNGATLTTGAATGAGVWCESTSATISNCVITHNTAIRTGGAHKGTLYNCTLKHNSASFDGGGAYYSILYNCLIVSNSSAYGGGVHVSTLYNCTLIGNNAPGGYGGGVWNSDVYNCLVVGNEAYQGGGLRSGNFYNCTVIGNKATEGGGVWQGRLWSCIVYSNQATATDGGPNWYTNEYAIFTNCCTTPSNPAGWAAGNITNFPIFITSGSGYGTNHVMGNYHLAADSLCINAGKNQSWMTNANDVRSKDLDGRTRIRYGTVDMGVYERINEGTIYKLW